MGKQFYTIIENLINKILDRDDKVELALIYLNSLEQKYLCNILNVPSSTVIGNDYIAQKYLTKEIVNFCSKHCEMILKELLNYYKPKC